MYVLELTSHEPTYSYNNDGSDTIPSAWATHIFQWIVIAVICQAIDIFGICTNIINIICFVKEGFKDSINISLLGLAVSDIGCLVPLVWTNICYIPAFSSADLPFSPIEVQYLTAGTPHVVFTHVTGWITALITLERCLCISMPLKVKSLITPTRTFVVIVCVFFILILSVAPVYVVIKLDTSWRPDKNRTILGLTFTSDHENVEAITYAINNAFVPFSSFLIIVICTIILVIQLRKTLTWRKSVLTSTEADNTSNRNRKVAKMVVMVSTLFIICFIPSSIGFLVMSFEPDLTVYGKYRNVLTIIGGLCVLLESINSSMNIFIYYHMSTKYRNVLRKLFRRNNMSDI